MAIIFASLKHGNIDKVVGQGDSVRFSCLHNLNQLNGGAVVGEMSRRFFTNENTLTVGCSCFVDSQIVMKAKLNNHGNLGALLQHELKPKSFLTISGAFDLKPCSRLPNSPNLVKVGLMSL
ncbi:Mitochondrial outer membrane protein porin 2 [Populus alba x Populus x berolinensis]|nr:Mitochondrial outer membrane protein porin 2 [Populus alba x Populus x berolinensis]